MDFVSDEEDVSAKVRLIYKGMTAMIAYMINNYYICTSYKEVSSFMHDILHYSVLPSDKSGHVFHIRKGVVDLNAQEFTSDCGQVIALYYETSDDIYYKAH